MAKKLKDLGGDKWTKYSSIKAAQKAGSIYYGKKLKSGKVKQMAAVLTSDLGKGQSLNSFMNEQLKNSSAAGMKPIVDPDGQNVGKDYYTNPKKIAGISRKEMLKIIGSGKPRIVRSSETQAERVKRISAQGASVTTVSGLRAILKDAGATPAKITETLKDPGYLKRLKENKIVQDSAIAQERGGRESAMIKRPNNSTVLEVYQKKPTNKRKTISTKKRIIANAAVRKFMRKEFPGRLSNIEIGDIVFFRTNSAGDPVVASIVKKGK